MKETTRQVLGCLMKRPQFLNEVDKYRLTPLDFSSRFEKYIFTAIHGLYFNGAERIQIVDIENYLNTNPSAKLEFEKNNGIDYLQDVQDFAQVENFQYYYDKLKKFNLLKDLKKDGFDISDYYEENLTSSRAIEINGRFEELTSEEIVNDLKKKILKLETDYASPEEVQTWRAADEIDELIESLGTAEEVGLPIQGKIYNQIINGAELGAFTVRSASSGGFKALPNSVELPTPNGYRQVKDIKVGDYLFDAFGHPTKVLGVYPQGEKEVYQITFKDGRTARCSKEHLWSFCTIGQKQDSKANRRFYTETLEQIQQRKLQNKDGQYQILIPMNYAVEYSKKNLPIPPYILGLILGDGSFRQQRTNKAFQYFSEDDFLPSIIANTMGWNLKKASEHNYTWYFSYKDQDKNVWVEEILKDIPELINTKSEDKFIPEDYLYSSVEDRFDLLRGLIDTDGNVDQKGGRISCGTVSKQLKDNIIELARGLGFKISWRLEPRENMINRLPYYEIRIFGRPQDKIKIVSLPKKKKRLLKWFEEKKRKESNEFNAIIKIENLGYTEEMTCFMVDNKEHLFLTENYVVTHNTRTAVADACYLAYPIRFNSQYYKWEQAGSGQKVLFIITEQRKKEILKMILAYLTDIPESRFKYADFTTEERYRISVAKEIMKQYADNMIIVRMPEPTVGLLKTIIREQCILKDIKYCFFDYIFINPALLREFSGTHLRNDELLLLMSTALKDLAVELNISVFTSTQVNSSADNNDKIRNESSIAGSRAVINKADNGCVMARPTPDELDTIKELSFQLPNLVTDVYKVRNGQWTQVRIWSFFNGGTMRREDLFVTDARMNVIEDFFEEPRAVIELWTQEEQKQLEGMVKDFNEGVIHD